MDNRQGANEAMIGATINEWHSNLQAAITAHAEALSSLYSAERRHYATVEAVDAAEAAIILNPLNFADCGNDRQRVAKTKVLMMTDEGALMTRRNEFDARMDRDTARVAEKRALGEISLCKRRYDAAIAMLNVLGSDL